MLTPLSLHNKLNNPEKIILPTQELISELKRRLHLIENFLKTEQEEDELIETILNLISYEKNAEMELAYNAVDVVKGAIGGMYEDSVVEFANAVVSFGTALIDNLRFFRLYQNGYLHYQLCYVFYGNIVLQKLYIPKVY